MPLLLPSLLFLPPILHEYLFFRAESFPYLFSQFRKYLGVTLPVEEDIFVKYTLLIEHFLQRGPYLPEEYEAVCKFQTQIALSRYCAPAVPSVPSIGQDRRSVVTIMALFLQNRELRERGSYFERRAKALTDEVEHLRAELEVIKGQKALNEVRTIVDNPDILLPNPIPPHPKPPSPVSDYDTVVDEVAAAELVAHLTGTERPEDGQARKECLDALTPPCRVPSCRRAALAEGESPSEGDSPFLDVLCIELSDLLRTLTEQGDTQLANFVSHLYWALVPSNDFVPSSDDKALLINLTNRLIAIDK